MVKRKAMEGSHAGWSENRNSRLQRSAIDNAINFFLFEAARRWRPAFSSKRPKLFVMGISRVTTHPLTLSAAITFLNFN